MPNPFSNKAGKKPNPFSARTKKPNPFSPNGAEPKDTARNRSTPKERAAAVRAAEKALVKPSIKNPHNPWVARAHDVATKLAEIDVHLAESSQRYTAALREGTKAKTMEDINVAFNRSDAAMNAVLNYAAQRRRLIGAP